MTPNLPFEICETIIDYLSYRSADLCSWALTCKAFAIRAQSHLFKSICIPASKSTEPHPLLCALRSSPYVSGFVQSMSIELNLNTDTFAYLAQCRAGWPRLQSLVLHPVFYHPENHENIHAVLLRAPLLHRLDITLPATVDTSATVYAILWCCSESLRVLGLRTVLFPESHCKPQTHGPPREPSTYPKIQELTIADPWHMNAIMVLAQPECPLDLGNLHSLRYSSHCVTNPKLISSFNRLLQKTTSLHHLLVNSSDELKLDTSSLLLLSHIETEDYSDIAAILAQFPAANSLAVITIHTSIIVDDWAQDNLGHGGEVLNTLPGYAARLQDVVVVGDRFPKLEKVILKIKPYDADDKLPITLEDMKHQLEEAFSELHKRGLLFVQFPEIVLIQDSDLKT